MENDHIDLATEFLRCRTFGHMWDDHPNPQRVPTFGELIALRCVRCKTERFDIIDVLGQVAQREYEYPKGYQYAERLARPDLRLEIIARRKAGDVGRRARRSA